MYQSNPSIQVTNQSEKRAGRCGWIVFLLIFIACLSALGHPPRKVVADAFSWSGPDFTYCYLFLRGWWDGALTNPYDYDQQRALLEQVYNYRGSVIMPAPWTPLSTLTLYPFLQSPDPANAVEVWNLATLAVFVGALLLWLREAISTRQELWSRALVGVMLLQSLPSAQTLEVGQTAFLGAGSLAIVVLLASHQWRLRDIAIAACLIGMAIKPTYVLVALSILAVLSFVARITVMNSERIFSWKELSEIPVVENGEALVRIESQSHLIGGAVTITLPGAGQITRPLAARSSVYQRLVSIQDELSSTRSSFALKVVDAHRPIEHQKSAFDAVVRKLRCELPRSSEESLIDRAHLLIAYPPVAGHPTGGAVDVTLVADGFDIDMGGAIAEFSDEERIRTFSSSITDFQKENRLMLRELMLSHGFAPFDGEWWHFCFGDREWAAYYGEKAAMYGPL